MALGMRHWIALTLLGCALVTVDELPPEAPAYASSPAPSADQERATVLGNQVRWSHELLKRLRWADSLPRLLASREVGGVDVGGPPTLDDSTRLAIRTRIRQEEGRLGHLDPQALVGYYVQPEDQSGQAGVPDAGFVWGVDMLRARPELLAGSFGGHPYCITVALIPRVWLRGPTGLRERYRASPSGTGRGFLGPCRLFVQFGPPGRQVEAWLAAGAISFAWANDAAPSEGVGRSGRPPAYRSLELETGSGIPGPDLTLTRCMAGRSRACLDAALREPGHSGWGGAEMSEQGSHYIASRSPFLRVGLLARSSIFGVQGDYLFSDLEAEFGPDAFARFWHSGERVPEAFRNAFGVDMGDWLVHWVGEHYHTYRAGPALPDSAVVGALLVVVLCAVIAGAVASRRSVAAR